VLVTTADAGVRDLRGIYRSALCRQVGDVDACARLLRRLPGEPAADAAAEPPPPLAELARRYRIAFVPGFFSECFDGYARPFADVAASLLQAGFAVDYFQVSGRGSVAGNAARLAAHFRAASGDPRPFILFAYSKGAVDVLELARRDPDATQRIAAVVTFAGAVNGSPLADDLLAVYRQWVASFPLPGCDRGQGDEIQDLRRDVRLEWWRKHGAAVRVPVFAIVAAPSPDRVSPGTRATYRSLSRIDPRNDGKLLWIDQVAPRAHLLGYADADHWAIAIPVAETFPRLAFLFRDGVPRAALVVAAIEVVALTLDANRRD
jgi:hypothetical protein